MHSKHSVTTGSRFSNDTQPTVPVVNLNSKLILDDSLFNNFPRLVQIHNKAIFDVVPTLELHRCGFIAALLLNCGIWMSVCRWISRGRVLIHLCISVE